VLTEGAMEGGHRSETVFEGRDAAAALCPRAGMRPRRCSGGDGVGGMRRRRRSGGNGVRAGRGRWRPSSKGTGRMDLTAGGGTGRPDSSVGGGASCRGDGIERPQRSVVDLLARSETAKCECGEEGGGGAMLIYPPPPLVPVGGFNRD
jgi:hypothetical protein